MVAVPIYSFRDPHVREFSVGGPRYYYHGDTGKIGIHIQHRYHGIPGHLGHMEIGHNEVRPAGKGYFNQFSAVPGALNGMPQPFKKFGKKESERFVVFGNKRQHLVSTPGI